MIVGSDNNSTKDVVGCYIAKYNYMYRNKKKYHNSDILEVINRLKQHKKYQMQLRKERRELKRRQDKKILAKYKKHVYKKIFSPKPISNPYVEMILKQRREGKVIPTVDRNLIAKYYSTNMYCLHEFRHMPLPRSDYQIKAGQAWHGLKKAWIGYKLSKDKHYDSYIKDYARATQKWAHMLELPLIPEFDDIGVTLKKFEESLKVKFLN